MTDTFQALFLWLVYFEGFLGVKFVLSDASQCETHYLDKSPLLTLQWVLGGSCLLLSVRKEFIFFLNLKLQYSGQVYPHFELLSKHILRPCNFMAEGLSLSLFITG